MKKKLVLFMLCLSSVATFAQHYVAEYEGGLKIGFDIADSTVEGMNHFRTGLFASYPNRSIGFLDFNYLAPHTGMAEAEVGIMGNIGLEGFLFFKQKTQMVKVGVPLKEQSMGSNTYAVYRIKTDEQRVNAFALHGGVFRRDILDCPGVSWVYQKGSSIGGADITTLIPPPSMFMEIAVGVTFLQIHNLKLVCQDQSKSSGGVRVRQRQKILYAGADLLYYPTAGNSKSILDTANFTHVGYTLNPPLACSPIGARLYLKGYGPGWGKVDWGYFYMLAVEESVCGPAYMAGLGLYIGY